MPRVKKSRFTPVRKKKSTQIHNGQLRGPNHAMVAPKPFSLRRVFEQRPAATCAVIVPSSAPTRSAPKRKTRPPIDQTVPHQMIYYRAWTKGVSAGKNSRTYFEAGNTDAIATAPETADDMELLRYASLHLTETKKPTPFISLTSSFSTAVRRAVILKRRQRNKTVPIHISVIDGARLTEAHNLWKSPDIGRLLRQHRLKHVYWYHGSFEILVLHRITKPCILACFTLEKLMNIAAISTIEDFVQLEQTVEPGRFSREKLAIPTSLNIYTGSAIGSLVNVLIIQSRVQDIQGDMIDRFVTSMLQVFHIPGREEWKLDKDFVLALQAAMGQRFTYIPREVTPERQKIEYLPTPPATGGFAVTNGVRRKDKSRTDIMTSSLGYTGGHSTVFEGGRSKEVSRLNKCEGGKDSSNWHAFNLSGTNLNEVQSLGPSSPTSYAQGDEVMSDGLSDVIGDDEELFLEAELTKMDDEQSDKSSTTLKGDEQIAELGALTGSESSDKPSTVKGSSMKEERLRSFDEDVGNDRIKSSEELRRELLRSWMFSEDE